MAKSLVKSELRKHLDYVISNIDKHPDELAKKIGTSERVYETVPMALSCFLHSPDEFQETVVNAANLCWGDTDSIACIAGAMSGAYNGYNKMPFEYKGKLEDRQRLEGLATELYDISEEIHPVDQSLRIRIDARAMAHNNPLALQAQDGDEVYRDYVEKLGNDIVNYMGQHGMPKVAEQMSKDRVIMLFGQSPDLVAVKFHSPEDKQGSGIVIDGPKENIHGIINYINGVNDISCPDKLMNYVAPEKR